VKDGEQIFLAVVSDGAWKAFCGAFGFGDLAADERLATNNHRVRARDWLLPDLRQRLAGHSAAELARVFEAHALPFAPITRPQDLFDDPHLNGTGGLAPLTLPDGRERMDKLKAFESFVSVATKGSLTAAAKAEGVAPAIMGRRLDALEEHLGVKLLVRTTRRITLTHEGSAFLEDCQRLLADVANAEASVSAGGVKASGHLRITAPAGFGRRHVAPLVPRFRRSTRGDDLAEPQRPRGGPGRRGLRLRRARGRPARFVAGQRAPGRQPAPVRGHARLPAAPWHAAAPGELARHDCLTLSSDASQTRGWAFRMRHRRRRGAGLHGEVVHLKPGGPLDCSDGQVLHDWCLAGYGIAWRSTWEVEARSPRAGWWPCWKTLPRRPTASTPCFRSASTCRCACGCGSTSSSTTSPMTLEALLAYAHLLAILTMVVFLASEAALCRAEWLNAAVVQRLARVDMIYGIASAAVLVTGLLRVFLGAKGAQWYGGNWLLYVKFGLFVVIGLLSIRPTRTFIRWRRAWLATGALPEPDAIRQTRKLIMWQAHILPLIPLAAVFLARGWEI
jgi:uncharacterized membrane protein/DNA-binding transcriptional LysR family regulator